MPSLTPIFSSVFGLIFLILWIGLVIFSVFKILANKEMDVNGKILWLLIVLIVPIGGALVFLLWRNVKRIAN
ncbi:PLDc N-terminal domain-containing protein [Mucilaginibacter sp. RS28]|uniref:PLDc N-terminal domain-containing protein n=1 Tax=Mucilaginibacter straminoryzae TaxID=2932774 RepID=A0A9X1WZE2_9SPHI|nr:PLDc N-terminal domain-containing protein [Mucilaginibacter straminoryzae]MCJ8208447.1 PLDc N-terminal domain-containing protein [Mucilaginibacter straminoryzae]